MKPNPCKCFFPFFRYVFYLLSIDVVIHLFHLVEKTKREQCIAKENRGNCFCALSELGFYTGKFDEGRPTEIERKCFGYSGTSPIRLWLSNGVQNNQWERGTVPLVEIHVVLYLCLPK